jgi:hypothetical protein
MFEYTVGVCWTTDRPVVPDQFYSRVTVLADTDGEAFLVAFAMAAGRRGVEMVTRCEIEAVLL